MDPTRNYTSIILSPPFTFLVGPQHTKLTIQSALAQHVSKPLHNLMNNGYTRESKHRIAVLEEEDVETFVAFCEYAYTGDYNVPQSPPPRQEETIRRGVAESVTSPAKSWRELHRSESMSSTVPPPAPSPPPESVRSNQTVQPREPEPVIEEDPPAEAAAEEGKQIVEETPAAVEDNDSKGSEQPEESTIEPNTSAQVEPEPEPETIPEPETNTVPGNEFDEWETATPELSKKAKKSAKKNKKKGSKQPTEETVVSLTPPSTPPPDASREVHEAPTTTTDTEAQSGNQDGDWWQEPSDTVEVGPKDETPYEAAAEPEAEPEQVPEQEWEVTADAEDTPAEETSGQDDWENNVEQTEEQEPQAPPKPFIDMSFAKQSQSDTSLRTPGQSMWEEFAALQYNDENLDSFLATPSSTTSDLPYLTFHAKVYVFATRYLIPALAQLCLRKLHRDLLSLSFENAEAMNPILESQPLGGLAALQAPMVLDVLQYAYTKTTRLEPISPTSATQLRENELRKLVVHFAACKVKELARYHLPGDSEAATPTVRPIDKVERTGRAPPKSLRVLLDMTPELASDLVYRMM